MLRTDYLATLKNLQWRAVGPGPDARVLLEAFASLNDQPFVFRAVRVFAPYTAGWTSNDSWESNPTDVTDHIAWETETLRLWVKVCDSLPEDTEAPPEPQVRMTRDMTLLDDWWSLAINLFFWSDADYPPALIDGMPYQVIGYPASEVTPGTDVGPSMRLSDAGWGNDTGEPGYRDGVLRIGDSAFRLFGFDMIGIHGASAAHHRPQNRKDEEVLRDAAEFLGHPFSRGAYQTTMVAGRPCLLLMHPLAPFDYRLVAEQPKPAEGSMLWYFPALPRDVALVAEAMARMVRARRMAFHENRPIIVGSTEDLDEWLPAFLHPERRLPALRDAMALSAFGVGCRDCSAEHIEPLFQDASGSGPIFYVEPSPMGLYLIDHLRDGQLLELVDKPLPLATPTPPDEPAFPDWVRTLPRMFDRQYRNLWQNFSGEYD